MSKFILTSQNDILAGAVDNKISCGSIYSQIGCDLEYFNISIQIENNNMINDNLVEVQGKIEDELISILAKAKELGWDIFDNINTKLNS